MSEPNAKKMVAELTALLDQMETFVRRWGPLSDVLDNQLTDTDRQAVENQISRIEEMMP